MNWLDDCGGLVAEILPARHGPLSLTVILLFAQSLALVVFLFTFGYRNLHFGFAIEEIQPQRNQGVATGSNAMS